MQNEKLATSKRKLGKYLGLAIGLVLFVNTVFLFTTSLQIVLLAEGNYYAPPQTSCQSALDIPRKTSNATLGGAFAPENNSLPLSSHCFYREFPFPDVEEGLPFITDAFADASLDNAVILALNRQEIFSRYAESDSAFFSDPETGRMHRFLCLFQGYMPVWSNPIHRPGFFDKKRRRAHQRTLVIQCKIPSELKHLIRRGQQETNLHVDLVAVVHHHTKNHICSQIENSQLLSPDMVADLPTIWNIPICHPLSNAADEISTKIKPKQFNLVAHTEIRSSYVYDVKQPVAEEVQFRFHEWIHYHVYHGFEHFVIYDNDPEDHGPLEKMLAPYVQKGLVTRVWNPWQNEHPEGNPKRSRKPLSQGMKGVAALWRYGHTTRLFANMDVDEFFLPMDPNTRVVNLVKDQLQLQPEWDGAVFTAVIVTYCNGTVLPRAQVNGRLGGTSPDNLNRQTELASKRCRTTSHDKGPKMIFDADRMWIYHTHNAYLTSSQTRPNLWNVPETTAYLAHYRRETYKMEHLEGDKDNVMILHDIEHPNSSMAVLDPYLDARDKEQSLMKLHDPES